MRSCSPPSNAEASGRVSYTPASLPADFAEALKGSRATVTPPMEEEYRKLCGELKARAAQVQPIGFISEGMLEPLRERKHG